MAEMTYQQRSNQSSRMAVNQQRSSGRVLQDNRASFKQSTQLKSEQPAQRLTDEEELQSNQPAQRVKKEDEDEALQKKSASTVPVQREEPVAKPNNTGLPDNLKSGIENLSGMSMDNVRVHYNSAKPAQLNALAYAQGTDIHVASGQEKHLPHEAWHVVQQAQGRVKPTMQMKEGVPVNDDKGLEREADVMGGRAVQMYAQIEKPQENQSREIANSVAQKKSTVKQGFGLVDNRHGDKLNGGNLKPVQRKINWNSSSKRLPLSEENNNFEGLINALKTMYAIYGSVFAQRINDVVNYANAHGRWSIADILSRLDADAKNFGIPLNNQGSGLGNITLPENESAQRDFAFSSHTRATAVIGGKSYFRESKDGVHAEKQLKELLIKLKEDGTINDVNEDTLIITINNFPCLERCVAVLIELHQHFPFMQVNYANPYGGEEFQEAYTILRGDGIALFPFEPRTVMGENTKSKLTSDQSDRFDEMARARAVHPTPYQRIYELSLGMRLDGGRFPEELENQVVNDIINGILRPGDRFLIRFSDGSDQAFAYYGTNKNGTHVIRPYLRGG